MKSSKVKSTKVKSSKPKELETIFKLLKEIRESSLVLGFPITIIDQIDSILEEAGHI